MQKYSHLYTSELERNLSEIEKKANLARLLTAVKSIAPRQAAESFGRGARDMVTKSIPSAWNSAGPNANLLQRAGAVGREIMEAPMANFNAVKQQIIKNTYRGANPSSRAAAKMQNVDKSVADTAAPYILGQAAVPAAGVGALGAAGLGGAALLDGGEPEPVPPTFMEGLFGR